MSTKKAIWISYDLGLKGDYTSLYSWLDSVKAKECGDSMAFFMKEFDSDIVKSLASEIQTRVNIQPKDRIYLIYKDDRTGKMKGKYLFGNRKRAPWEGFATSVSGAEEDISE